MTQGSSSTFKTIGFIGLGAMGSRMVTHLKGVADIRVYDTDTARATKAAAAVGGRAVDGIAGMDAADVVILMLPTSAIVDQVLHTANGVKGLLDYLAPGAMVIDMSSSAPTNSVSNAELAAKRGIRFIDAPVSGGIKGAEAASLAIMAGGSQADYDRALPLLQRMGGKVFLVGKVGAGHAVKALNNLLAATILAATSEVFAVGAKFGLDPAMMLKVIDASSGQSFQTTHVWQTAVIERTFSFGFTLALMEKDVRVAMSLFDAMGSDAKLSRTSAAIWAKALATAAPGSDMTIVAKQAEQALGLQH
jgi:3-hydroxyisobutyrate dehydrogenase